MSSLIDPREILDIAQTIESNGADFYRKAAVLHPKIKETAILLKLAEMEEEHKQTFAMMQAELFAGRFEKADQDFINNIGAYLKAVTDSQSLEGSAYATYLFSGKETIQDIIRLGIELEKQTILFYIGLADIMKKESDKKVMKKIIKEERDHIITLAGYLKKSS